LAIEQRILVTSRPVAKENWITFLNICQRDAEVKLNGPTILWELSRTWSMKNRRSCWEFKTAGGRNSYIFSCCLLSQKFRWDFFARFNSQAVRSGYEQHIQYIGRIFWRNENLADFFFYKGTISRNLNWQKVAW
jgi:hypothetical protein